jgi:hypothetical protein
MRIEWQKELDNLCDDIQLNIWISHLVRHHQYKYPLSWYLNLSRKKIKAMYDDMLKKIAASEETLYKM